MRQEDRESMIHILVVPSLGQGNVNPMLRLGKLLASKGLLVTFSPPESVGRYIRATNNFSEQLTPIGDGYIRLEPFEDGWEDNLPGLQETERYLNKIEQMGRESLAQLINRNTEKGQPVTCLINNLFTPWVVDVAEGLGIPFVTFWIQSCACFAAYYHYYHGLVAFPDEENPEIDVQLPCMPLLKSDEVPTFLHPTTPYPQLGKLLLYTCKNLDKPLCILMETFEELEPEIIEYMSRISPFKAVGPLFRHPLVQKATLYGDFLEAEDCMEWLDSKPSSSVVYISFGSIANLDQEQWNEIAYGILNSGVTFLLVTKSSPKSSDGEILCSPEWLLEKAGNKGKLVQWSPQEKVLSHPSIACFMTHCGWNSSMEALAYGVPVVTFPMWGDQVTNCKYLVDVFKVGVKMDWVETAEKKLITRGEVERCLSEASAGPKAEEMKGNAMKWKTLAEAAVAEGGSSDMNVNAFVEEVMKISVELKYKLK